MFYHVVDNFLNKDQHNYIYELTHSDQFPYYYNKGVVYAGDGNFIFSHNLKMHGEIKSPNYEKFLSFFSSKINFFEVYRMRVNCYPKEHLRRNHGFHVDLKSEDYPNFKYTVGLYYINTNNGGTILKIGDKEIFIESVENRMVFFDGDVYHSSVSHTDTDLRLNVNINFK